LTRLKGSHGLFPARSITECLRIGGLKLSELDRIAFGWDSTLYPKNMFLFYLKKMLVNGPFRKTWTYDSPNSEISNNLKPIETLLAWSPTKIKTEIRDGLREAGFKEEIPKVSFVSHHLAHAYSTYFCSDFDSSLILTLDGSGEKSCTELSIGTGDKIKSVYSIDIPHSLGWFYAAFTAYCGFTPYRDEGKFMGLAALGEERKENNPWVGRLKEVLQFGSGWYKVDPSFTRLGGHYYHSRFTDKLVKFITDYDSTMVPLSYGEKIENKGRITSSYLQDKYVDLAWAVQETLERATISLVNDAVDKYKIRNLCLAGGVALNCKMNGSILEKTKIENLFVQPASSDDGVSLGAAMFIAQKLGDNVRNNLIHSRFGVSYSNTEVEEVLKNLNIRYRKSNKISVEVANYLADNKIVAWHQGPMEFGPRALGGRSILANPFEENARDKVNERVKFRESWRPFCPSLTADSFSEYLKSASTNAPFMIVAYRATQKLSNSCPAVVHVDGTVRPQTVTSSSNPKYYEMINYFGQLTGHPVVLNTSLNVRGEPICCSPFDSLKCFFTSGIDILAIEDFIIDKSKLT